MDRAASEIALPGGITDADLDLVACEPDGAGDCSRVVETLTMFHFHGWLTLLDRDRADELGDRTNTLLPETLHEIQAAVERDGVRGEIQFDDHRAIANAIAHDVGFGSLLVLHQANERWHLTLSGMRNHRQQWLIDLFIELGRLAPGSYGVLHIWDDEVPDVGKRDDWQRLVMIRGRVSERRDPDFSPHVPTIEDD